MILPLAEEIAEARTLVDESFRAMQLTASLYLVRFLLEQLANADAPRGDEELPGEGFIVESCSFWRLSVPELPPPEAPMSAHVAVRLQQILQVEAVLQPLADVYIARNGELGGLVHDQYHLLADPMFEDVVTDIEALERQREALMTEVGPIQARQTGIPAMIAAIQAYREVVGQAIASADPVFWQGCAEAVRDALASMSVALSVPMDPPAATDNLRRDLVVLEGWLVEREQTLAGESAVNMANMVDISNRYAAITAKMQGQTG